MLSMNKSLNDTYAKVCGVGMLIIDLLWASLFYLSKNGFSGTEFMSFFLIFPLFIFGAGCLSAFFSALLEPGKMSREVRMNRFLFSLLGLGSVSLPYVAGAILK